MVGRRHGSEEIAGKLAEADDMAAKGKNQQEISKALGISVMTYHRWRKLRGPAVTVHRSVPDRRVAPTQAEPERDGASLGSSDRHGGDRLRDLELENLRLRRLVTDLLLEKVGLEEELRERRDDRIRRARR
jgi:hypothetical protein